MFFCVVKVLCPMAVVSQEAISGLKGYEPVYFIDSPF